MSPDNAAERATRLEHATPDHLPVCPRCHDVSDAGAERCESCGAALLAVGAKHRPTLAELAAKAPTLPEPERSVLAAYWLENFSDAEIAEFVAGLSR